MKAERRTIEPGTARNPAARKRFSPQPSNFDGTLSHHDAPPAAPAIGPMSLSRNESSTAFLSHWLTCHLPFCFSATRASPLSSSSSAVSTASRTAPLVDALTSLRASKASSIVLASSDIRNPVKEGPGFSGWGAAMSRPRQHCALEKACQVVGDVIDMRGLAPFHFPGLAQHLARSFRNDQHRGHAERVRDSEIARQILEHRGALRIDAVCFEKLVIGL